MSEARKARLGTHSMWQLRDYLMDKGLGTAMIVLLMVLIDWLGLRSILERATAMMQDTASMKQDFMAMRFPNLIGMLSLLGALFATNGIVSDDRKNGYYRFLFSKPATAPAFYAWKFAMNGVGFILVALLFLAAYAVAFRPFLPENFVMGLALVFVALGGVGFLLSALWRWDWLSLITIYVAAQLAWAELADSARWKWIPYLLPPVHKLDGVYAAIARETALPAQDLAWLTGYGLVCFLLGLLVLRYRALATD